MADLTVTAASVLWVSGPKGIYIAGAALTAGQAVYIDANGKAQLALNDTAAHAAAVGVVLDNAASGQPVAVALPGSVVTVGATTVQGGVYHVSTNAGGIAPEADYATGHFVTQVGRAPNTTQLLLEMTAYGYAHG